MENDFRKHLRAALNHLFNPEQLRQSPLIDLLKISDRFDSPSVLQHILIDAIEAIRPKQNEPLHSEKRKTYDILLYRYVQQFKQDEVAHHLGVSDRQFRREQDTALELLSLYIWDKFVQKNEATATTQTENVQPGVSTTAAEEHLEEWEWLKKARTNRITDLETFVQKILDLIQAVGNQYHAATSSIIQGNLPDLAVHPIALRQILLNLLQVAIHQAEGGRVILELATSKPFVEFKVRSIPEKPQELDAHQAQDDNLLDIAKHLSDLSGGRLAILKRQAGFDCYLALPAVEGLPILVIDDNPEIIELLQRFTNGTRYNVIGSSDPELAIELADTSGAYIIVIDVMMPKIDGWELLGRLRSHPRTSAIPVIVLSILAQEDLALSLGARKLVLKPVTQEVFLGALDEVLVNSGSESR